MDRSTFSMTETKFGTVDWWDDELGRGNIIGNDGKALYVNHTLVKKRNILYRGETVTYVEKYDPMYGGPVATKVEVLP